jgi:hypothetical protein
MQKENGNLPILDIHQAAFLNLHGIEPDLTKQGTRVIFEFPNTKQVLDLIQAYNGNPALPVLNFVHHLRKLRSQMLAAR